MNLLEYQKQARSTAVYLDKPNNKMVYPAIGLIGECGEVAEKVKKLIRDDNGNITPQKIEAIKKELGDCMWYCANICCDTDQDLSVIYEMRGHLVVQQIKELTLVRLVFHMSKHASVVADALNHWYHDDNGDLGFTGKYLMIPNSLSQVVGCVDAIAKLLDLTLEDICVSNLNKLADRKKRDTLRGEGDSR